MNFFGTNIATFQLHDYLTTNLNNILDFKFITIQVVQHGGRFIRQDQSSLGIYHYFPLLLSLEEGPQISELRQYLSSKHIRYYNWHPFGIAIPQPITYKEMSLTYIYSPYEQLKDIRNRLGPNHPMSCSGNLSLFRKDYNLMLPWFFDENPDVGGPRLQECNAKNADCSAIQNYVEYLNECKEIKLPGSLALFNALSQLMSGYRPTNLIPNISPDRIDFNVPKRVFRDLLERALAFDHSSNYFQYMKATGILEYFIPELYQATLCTQNEYHSGETVYTHTLRALDEVDNITSSKDLSQVLRKIPIKLAVLFHDLGKINTKEVKS